MAQESIVLESKEMYGTDVLGSSGQGFNLETLAPVAPLDYPKLKLLMEVSNPIEQQWRIKSCDKEPWTVAFIESCPPGSWFIDIGASTGPYTLVAIANKLNAVAIEPSFESYRRLCRNLALNQMLDQAIVFCIGLGRDFSLEWMNYFDIRAGAGSNRIANLGKKTWHRQLVPIWPLDSLVQLLTQDAPIYVKLDVDGDEDAVLAGANNLLHSPQLQGIISEMPISLEQSMIDRFKECGLTLVNRFDQRAGQKIQGVCYGEFRRL